jgi:TolB-like protein
MQNKKSFKESIMTLFKAVKFGTLVLVIGLTVSLAGCSSSFFADNSNLCIGDNGVYQRCGGNSGDSASAHGGASNMGNNSLLVHELLPEYVEQLATDLVANMHNIKGYKAIAITSFVSFNSDLRQGDLFGNQLSELMYGQLQQLDLSLADHNVRNYVETTPSGAFALSREFNEYDDLPFDYVLTGTWVRAKKGIIVNARIVGLYNKKVITTASTLIPNFILSADYNN